MLSEFASKNFAINLKLVELDMDLSATRSDVVEYSGRSIGFSQGCQDSI